jgi:subtilase family serine protease
MQRIARLLVIAIGLLGGALRVEAATITVTGTGSAVAADGVCTLTEAIQAANTNAAVNECPAGEPGPIIDIIAFNISGAGPYIISPASDPVLIDPVIIDGYTQPGASPNTLPFPQGLNTLLRVQVMVGLAFNGPSSSNSTVRGLAVRGIWMNPVAGVGPSSITVQGNFIGTDVTGTLPMIGPSDAVRIDTSSDNTVGGPNPADRNLVSSQPRFGIFIQTSSSGNLVEGNLIGTDITGTASLGHGADGIIIHNGSANNTIAGNVIAFNGTGFTGDRAGITLTSSSGGGNAILDNAIFSNAGLGIDFSDPDDTLGVTPNDPGDGDDGANHRQNFPVLTSAVRGAGIAITGTLDSVANQTFHVEFFTSSACDASGFGEGETFLGSTSVLTDGTGNASISVTLPADVPVGPWITATATDPANNTSEFSACMRVTQPDLVETAVTDPPAAQARGTSFSVTDTAKNQGSVASGATTTRYYLSLDTVKDAGDTLLTGSRAVLVLAPGATDTGTVTVTIPAATPLGTYFLLACADDLNVEGESDEGNNCTASAGTVEVAIKPDLVEVAVSNPPAAMAPGTSFSVTDTVKNQGAVAAGASSTRYYLSLNAVKDAADTLLTGIRAVAALAPGAIDTGTVTVIIPAATPFGTYFLLACADSLSSVAETNEGNNCTASAGTMAVTRPDLVERAVSGPPVAAVPGTSFSVTDTVKNQGAVAAGASTTRYYLSLNPVKDASDILLTGSRAVPALAPGATDTGTVTVTIPTATALNTYFLLACADNLNVVAETNEGNNCTASVWTVEVARPDLLEETVANPPATAAPGTTISVTDTIRNWGAVATGPSTTRYYLSLNAVKDAADTLLTGSRAVPALAPWAADTGTVSVTIPADTPLNTYFLIACADSVSNVVETNEGNNCTASAGTVMVTRPDLIEDTVANPPATAAPGTTISVTDTVKNQGLVAAAASTTRYYLSLNTVKDAADALLPGSRAVPALAPGAIHNGTVTVTIPVDTPLNTYYLIACADNLNIVVETNEGNNCTASTGTVTVTRPDLIEDAVSDPPATKARGTTFSVTDTVHNQGAVASGASTTRYYLSLNAVKDVADPLLPGSRAVPALAPGATHTGTVTVTIPAGFALNTYYLLACTDNQNAVVETNETNNCTASINTVIVTP